MASGQALLLVVLVVAASLIVVLSVVSKSVTDVTITSTEEDSLRAFSAAEAGVEEALLSLGSGAVVDPEGSVGTGSQTGSYEGTVTQNSAGSSFNYPEQLLSGDTGTIWFADRDEDGNFDCSSGKTCTQNAELDLCWETSVPEDSQRSAVELTVFYDTTNSYLNNDFSNVAAKTFMADSVNRQPENGILHRSVSSSCDLGSSQTFETVHYYKQTTFNLSSDLPSGADLIMAKVRLLYNTSTPQGFGVHVVAGSLPAQGYIVSSSGTAGATRRKVQVFQGYPEPPAIFDSALFSLRGLER